MAFYQGKDTTTTPLTFFSKSFEYYADNRQVTFRLENVMPQLVFEYLLMYHHFALCKDNEKRGLGYGVGTGILRTGKPTGYIPTWPTTGDPPTIENFKYMLSYIKWWKSPDGTKDWKEIFLDHFVVFIRAINCDESLSFLAGEGLVGYGLWHKYLEQVMNR